MIIKSIVGIVMMLFVAMLFYSYTKVLSIEIPPENLLRSYSMTGEPSNFTTNNDKPALPNEDEKINEYIDLNNENYLVERLERKSTLSSETDTISQQTSEHEGLQQSEYEFKSTLGGAQSEVVPFKLPQAKKP